MQTVKEIINSSVMIPEYKMTCTHKQKLSSLPMVQKSRDAKEIFESIYEPETIGVKEFFYVMYLNKSNKVLGHTKISEGGMTGTVADPRLILKGALLVGATSLILSHNHPSGNLRPSKADEELTQKIKEAAKYIDVRVLDHLILNEEGEFYSFADEGIL